MMAKRPTPKNLAEQLRLDEGSSRTVYQDTRGYWTIGIGRLCDPDFPTSGLTEEEQTYLLNNDIQRVMKEAGGALPYLFMLDPVRRDCVMNMVFQMGAYKVSLFKDLTAALLRKDWLSAAAAMRDSNWYKQTPERAERLRIQMLNGTYQ